ncbi:MAG TPA: lipid-A-disaccharide synthase, partial [Burkholderiaceae bacterium]|nr:lipid-A-disaccharide synthase [Burkholderiaceae bacterium]
GIGGDRMLAAGFDAWHHVRELSVRGYVEVLRHLPRLLRLRRALRDRVIVTRPQVFVGIDAPDFNLALEEQLRRRGVRTVHFVSPSIWAWRAERIKQIARAVDRMLLIFPFEQKIYDDAGIPASYVGHPLASMIPMVPDAAAARRRLGLRAESALLAVLLGSRPDEVRHNGPTFVAAMSLLAAEQPTMRFVMPVADARFRSGIEQMVAAQSGLASKVDLVDGRSHDCLEASDVVLVASGTATLEAALFKRPMVIAYKMSPLTAWIMWRKGRIPYVGLPNILAGEFVVPELLQHHATPATLARAVLEWQQDRALCERTAARFTEMHHSLKRDTARLVADAIFEVAA